VLIKKARKKEFSEQDKSYDNIKAAEEAAQAQSEHTN
jgi:hypothetical protein